MFEFSERLRQSAYIPLMVLQSLCRAMLVREKGILLPLAGVEFARFAAENWAELGFDSVLRTEAGVELARVFGVCPASAMSGISVASPASSCSPVSVTRLSACSFPRDTAALVYEAWSKGRGEIFFFSSGSTGAPKAALHSWGMLMQEINGIDGIMGTFSSMLALTPLQHSYGFIFSVLLPALRRVPTVAFPPLPSMARESIKPGMLVVGFPDFWRNMPHDGYTPPPQVRCVSATAPWPAAEHHALRRSGFADTLEIYGSSENGVMGWRKNPDLPFELFSHWRRADEDKDRRETEFIRIMPDGAEARMPVQDMLEWTDERRFRPAGRLDNAVQVSGINVYPARIARTIGSYPGVRECRARLMRPEEGRRIKVFIVPESGCDEKDLRTGLKEFFRKYFNAPERPASVTFGASLPKTMYGKDTDW